MVINCGIVADFAGQSQPLTTMKRFQRALQAASSAQTCGDQSDSLLPVLQEATRSVNASLLMICDILLGMLCSLYTEVHGPMCLCSDSAS